MNPRFNDIFSKPENEIFRVVFYPDRIYHAQYLNATRSPRYRYNVREVRSKLDITVLKGEVFLDGAFLCNFLRLEYRSSRLVEQSRVRGRLAQEQIMAWVKLLPDDATKTADAYVKMDTCRWTDAYQVEIWETLEPPPGVHHDFQILDLMGHHASITRVKAFGPALQDISKIFRIEVAFRENDRDLVSGFEFNEPSWDNNFLSSHQEPRTSRPSAPENTVDDQNYLLDFQRGWYLQAEDIQPVRYQNAMMDPDNPDFQKNKDNIVNMRWLLQRELGSSVVFFHEVTVDAGMVEGTHQHIGSEELYYIVEGEGVAYMGEGDDPATAHYPTVDRHIYGLGVKKCKELPVRPGNVIFTKSGGIHGIRALDTGPLKFVAFLYHSA
jgi:mannose-6-phosphate isomerase-like protein (cupin superfamily)